MFNNFPFQWKEISYPSHMKENSTYAVQNVVEIIQRKPSKPKKQNIELQAPPHCSTFGVVDRIMISMIIIIDEYDDYNLYNDDYKDYKNSNGQNSKW